MMQRVHRRESAQEKNTEFPTLLPRLLLKDMDRNPRNIILAQIRMLISTISAGSAISETNVRSLRVFVDEHAVQRVSIFAEVLCRQRISGAKLQEGISRRAN
jgi:hypothetical protein